MRSKDAGGEAQNSSWHGMDSHSVGGNLRVVKMYNSVRTAHLERVRPGLETTILHRFRGYDFDEDTASAVNLRVAGVFGALWFGLTSDVDVIEINEPIIARTAPRSLAIIGGNRLRVVIRRGFRASVVSYAIENKDPRDVARAMPLKSRWKWRLQSLLIPAVWRRVDRMAFGTSDSRDLYRVWFSGSQHWPVHRLIPALPVARLASGGNLPRARSMVFVGDFSARKGFDKVLAAWAEVRETVPDATLVLVGKGEGVQEALRLASHDGRVRVEANPPRLQIFQEMSAAKVLILPSQPTAMWREQVGLPIVEGLSMGCLIVTTGETGLAEWLRSHGHSVVAEAGDVVGIAQAATIALLQDRSPKSVMQDLPEQDGREAAEDWLLANGKHWSST